MASPSPVLALRRRHLGAVYSALAHRLASFPGEVYPLHVGDTWMEPPEGCRMEDLKIADWPGMHRYAAPRGHAAAARRGGRADDAPAQRRRNRGATTCLIATGATGALGGGRRSAILAPGDEVHAPGAALAAHARASSAWLHGVPVEVPCFGFGLADSPESAVEIVEGPARRAHRGPLPQYALQAIHRPGQIIARPVVEALVAWAERHDLWILADEVYEDYAVYEGERTWCRPLAPDRTLAVHSFSKATAWRATAAATWWARPAPQPPAVRSAA